MIHSNGFLVEWPSRKERVLVETFGKEEQQQPLPLSLFNNPPSSTQPNPTQNKSNHPTACSLQSVGNRGVGNLRLIGLVELGPASRVFTFHLLDSLLTATTKISICSYSNTIPSYNLHRKRGGIEAFFGYGFFLFLRRGRGIGWEGKGKDGDSLALGRW